MHPDREPTYRAYGARRVELPGETCAVLLSVVDITEQVRTRKRLEAMAAARAESEAELKDLIAGISEDVIITDGDGNVLLMNTSALRRRGFEDPEEIRLNIAEFGQYFELRYLDGTIMPVDEWSLARSLRGEQVDGYEAQVLNIRTGDSFIGSYRAQPIRDDDGRIVRIVITFRDITEQKRTEVVLRETERRLRSVLDSLFVFVGMLSPDGVLVETNRAPLDAAAIERDDTIGKPFWDCYWWSYSAEVQADLKRAVARALEGEMVRYDVTLRMANDSRMEVDFAIAPLRNADGTITHLIPSAVDITERKRAERRSEFLLDLSDRGTPIRCR